MPTYLKKNRGSSGTNHHHYCLISSKTGSMQALSHNNSCLLYKYYISNPPLSVETRYLKMKFSE